MTLEEFLASDLRNVWLHEPGIDVYVRKTNRFLDGHFIPRCLDVANIEVREDMQHQGIFKAWLLKAEGLAKAVYIENVHNPVLVPFLLRSGYVERPLLPDCFMKYPTDYRKP